MTRPRYPYPRRPYTGNEARRLAHEVLTGHGYVLVRPGRGYSWYTYDAPPGSPDVVTDLKHVGWRVHRTSLVTAGGEAVVLYHPSLGKRARLVIDRHVFPHGRARYKERGQYMDLVGSCTW